jgi:hypothetical protein
MPVGQPRVGCAVLRFILRVILSDRLPCSLADADCALTKTQAVAPFASQRLRRS